VLTELKVDAFSDVFPLRVTRDLLSSAQTVVACKSYCMLQTRAKTLTSSL